VTTLLREGGSGAEREREREGEGEREREVFWRIDYSRAVF